MKNILIGIVGTLITGALVLAAAIYGGFVDVSADTPHSALVGGLIETARERAIERSIQGIIPPQNLADAQRVQRGAGNYDAMCVGCHLSPDAGDSEIRKGLYPVPPNLTKADRTAADIAGSARQFWIIKHGIKATGMAAWAQGGMGDAELWDLVAFLQRLPALSAAEYQTLVAASGGHSHAGLVEQGPGDHHDQAPAPTEKGHSHKHHHH